MLKQEVVAEINTGSQLPPLNNLPQWSRINTLDKARYPKPFLKDRLQPLPSANGESMAGAVAIQTGSAGSSDDRSAGSLILIQPSTDINSNQRIQHLEKSIHFLQMQHHEVLGNLHDEIEKLRRDNKELQFHIIMLQRNSSPGTSASQSAHIRRKDSSNTEHRESAKGSRNKELSAVSSAQTKLEDVSDMTASDEQSAGTESKSEELKVIFLEDEVKDLKKQLKEEKGRNHYLTQLLQQAEKQKLQSQQQNLDEDQLHAGGNASDPTTGAPLPPGAPRSGAPGSAAPLPYNATMVPLQVRLPHKNPRPPTLAECEVIIRHLQQHNDRQAHELNQLKADLRDVLYSHKWTPDAYLLAKAYVAQDDAREITSEKEGQLPRIALKQPLRKLPDVAYIQRDSVALPALKQTMGNKAIERRKRTQIMQKSRVRREVLH